MSELRIVEDQGEPVMVKYTFYADILAAAEAIWDDGGDPAVVVAHPCTIGKAGTPDILEYVEESWFEQYEDPDVCEVPEAVKDACVEFQKLLEAYAPECWIPRTDERVLLPAIEAAS